MRLEHPPARTNTPNRCNSFTVACFIADQLNLGTLGKPGPISNGSITFRGLFYQDLRNSRVCPAGRSIKKCVSTEAVGVPAENVTPTVFRSRLSVRVTNSKQPRDVLIAMQPV